MSVNWKTVSGRSLLLLVVYFVLFGIIIHKAIQFADAASTEKTTVTYNASMHIGYHSYHFYFIKDYTCNYDFMVVNVSYSGDGPCPNRAADDPIKVRLSGSSQILPIQNATVYYDPSNPSLNSLTEFSVRSKAVYQEAILPIGIGAIILVFVILGVLLEAIKNKGNGRIFVDAYGTVIDAEEIVSDPAFGELPGRSKWGAESFSGVNDKVAKAVNFASSHGLRELYLDVVKHIHPDRAANEADRTLRERLTKDANVAFSQGDVGRLRSILEEYSCSAFAAEASAD